MTTKTGQSLIIDAGPALTFMAAGHRKLLLEVIERRGNQLQTPEAVVEEVARKAGQQKRFANCETALNGLIARGQIKMLLDDITDQALTQQVRRITGVGTAIRLGESRDLGETMVIAHALKQKAAGEEVHVLIDEWRGQKVAVDHGIKVVSTEAILIRAISLQLIADRGEMRKVYSRLRDFDEGLVHIDQTQLLDRERYRLAKG